MNDEFAILGLDPGRFRLLLAGPQRSGGAGPVPTLDVKRSEAAPSEALRWPAITRECRPAPTGGGWAVRSMRPI